MDETTVRIFGPFTLDLSTGELWRGGLAIPVQPQPARVLTTLVARAGSVVSREHLRDAVWGDATHVDFDRGLNYCVRHLRTALGDDARRPQFIETVARQGYRFVAPVAAKPRTASAHRRLRTVAGAAALAAVLLTVAVERGGRNQRHHEMALVIARAVHDFIF